MEAFVVIGPLNKMEVSGFDLHANEDAVVERVTALGAALREIFPQYYHGENSHIDRLRRIFEGKDR